MIDWTQVKQGEKFVDESGSIYVFEARTTTLSSPRVVFSIPAADATSSVAESSLGEFRPHREPVTAYVVVRMTDPYECGNEIHSVAYFDVRDAEVARNHLPRPNDEYEIVPITINPR